MRRLFRKLLVFLLLMAAVYVFCPRFPSLEGFRPQMIAALECEVFEMAKARQSIGMLVALYRIFKRNSASRR